jgi:hypothetical protein
MSDQPHKPGRRRRWLIAAIIVTVIAAYIGWSNHTWHDPRFVGAWRVINSKSPHQSIFILNADGTGAEQELLNNVWLIRGNGWHWSISRKGFLFENIPSRLSHAVTYVTALGGLAIDGKLRPFRFVGNAPYEIVSVDANTITLFVPQEGIIVPLYLTLQRLDPKDVPPARP